MLRRDTIVLIIAGLCGVLAFFLIFNFLKEASSAKKAVVIAAVDLDAGHVLTEEDLAYSNPLKGINSKEFFLQHDDAYGKIVIEPIAKGKAVRRENTKKPEPVVIEVPVEVEKKPQFVDRALAVPIGKTSLTLDADKVSSLPSNLEVGNFINLVGWTTDEKTKKKIMSNVSPGGAQLISVERDDAGRFTSMTLAVEPEDLQPVFNAMSSGKLNMAASLSPAMLNQNKPVIFDSLEIIRGTNKSKAMRFKREEGEGIDDNA